MAPAGKPFKEWVEIAAIERWESNLDEALAFAAR